MTMKSLSSHTNSWKEIHQERLEGAGLVEEVNKEDLKSSSSADTITIKDKFNMPDKNKLKEFVDNRYDQIDKYKEENIETDRENASSISSTSFKALNLFEIDNKITKTLRPSKKDSYEIYPLLSNKRPIYSNTAINKNLGEYYKKVQRGLNTIERLKLWKSLPNRTKYMEYYRGK